MFKETYSCAKLWRSAAFHWKEYSHFQRNLHLCKVLLKRQRKIWKQDRITTKWNPLSNHFNRLWCSLKKVLVQVCAKPPSQGSERFDWKLSNNTKKHYYEVEPLGVCSIVWKIQFMQFMGVCMPYMQYARPYYMSEAPEQNRQHIWQRGTAFWDEAPSLVVRKSQVLHLFGSFKFHSSDSQNDQKTTVVQKKWEWGWTSSKDVLHCIFPQLFFFCKDAAS